METVTLEQSLEAAPEVLREALLWFHSQKGQEISWPSPSPVASLENVVSKAKAIYKPRKETFVSLDETVALSIRDSLNPFYENHLVDFGSNGSWAWAYHQEGDDPLKRDQYDSGQALMRNIASGSPVAVLKQTKQKPDSLYRVLGLAIVTRWADGYFYLEGFSDNELARTSGTRSEDEIRSSKAKKAVNDESGQAPNFDHDSRDRIETSIVRRQGQGRFRSGLLAAYQGACAITGCPVEEVLDAAHILPYKGSHTDVLTNGLLIKTDLHTLFDRGLIAIDPETRTVIVARSLHGTEFAVLNGVKLRDPVDGLDKPTKEVLQMHIDWCGDRLTGSHPDSRA